MQVGSVFLMSSSFLDCQARTEPVLLQDALSNSVAQVPQGRSFRSTPHQNVGKIKGVIGFFVPV